MLSKGSDGPSLAEAWIGSRYLMIRISPVIKGKTLRSSRPNAKWFWVMGTYSAFTLFIWRTQWVRCCYRLGNLLNNVFTAIPPDLDRLGCSTAEGFGLSKTNKNFQERAQTSGTRVTIVIIEGWALALVGDSRCILELKGDSIICQQIIGLNAMKKRGNVFWSGFSYYRKASLLAHRTLPSLRSREKSDGIPWVTRFFWANFHLFSFLLSAFCHRGLRWSRWSRRRFIALTANINTRLGTWIMQSYCPSVKWLHSFSSSAS